MAGIVATQMSEPVAASQSFLLPDTETAGLSYLVAGPTTITSNSTFVSTSPVLTVGATGGNTQVAVQGTATNGIAGSFQGGTAPLRLVPGPLTSRGLSAIGHQAGELYVTSDHLLFFFDGSQWRQVQLTATTTTITPTPTPTVPTPTVLPGLTPTVPPTVPPTPVPGSPNPLPPGRSSVGTAPGK